MSNRRSRRALRALPALALALLLMGSAACAEHTRDEVRARYGEISDWASGDPYAQRPAVSAPYDAGALRGEVEEDTLDYLNFIRWLAGVGEVRRSEIYDYQCQHGATLLAALDYVDHNAPRPADMEVNFYDSAHLATSASNVAKFNWMRPSILRDGVAYFLRDDGEGNLPTLGHRRWALNPLMAATGFGLANAESGMSYVLMYAHDLGNPGAEWDRVCWPCEGAFPAELMHADLAWSVVLNPARYDLAASRPAVTLTEETLGLSFRFGPDAGEGYFGVNAEGYGAGPCLIFRPDFAGTDFTDYQQNQCWRVAVTGLMDKGGAPVELDYTCRMIALRAVDPANVEIAPLSATLAPGESLRMDAAVIPAYADDLSVEWRSSDPAVAAVDADGLVTALSPGECEIVARAVNGREDACALTVAAEE